MYVFNADGTMQQANPVGSPGVVPLPPSLALFFSGLGAFGLTAIRKKQKASV
jgi:hypothetical protein